MTTETTAGKLSDHDPSLKRVKRVGLWNLEWQPCAFNTVWAISSRHKTPRPIDMGVLYKDNSMGWAYISAPKSVHQAARQFAIECQTEYRNNNK